MSAYVVFFIPYVGMIDCSSTSLFLPVSREELQDVAENEIESNWDQVVDKYVIIILCQQGYL